jgi:hypothetical protein
MYAYVLITKNIYMHIYKHSFIHVYSGWHNPEILPYGNLSLSPACSALHYGIECYITYTYEHPYTYIYTYILIYVYIHVYSGWHNPEILPYGNLSLSPACSALHYGIECFEGMKAYKDDNGGIR